MTFLLIFIYSSGSLDFIVKRNQEQGLSVILSVSLVVENNGKFLCRVCAHACSEACTVTITIVV